MNANVIEFPRKPIPHEGSAFAEALRVRDDVRERVIAYCRQLNLCAQQTADCIGAAQAAIRSGKSLEVAIAVGQAKASQLSQTQRELRTRYGTRPDNDFPPAA